MKKKIFTAALVVTAVVVFCTYCSSFFGEHFKKDLEGNKTTIQWEYVNLRADHSQKSDIVAVLHEGVSITLTGYTYVSFSAEGLPNESWREVTTEDGQTGWIVTDSIQW